MTIVGNPDGLGEALADLLGERGVEATWIEEMEEPDALGRAVIYLGGLAGVDDGDAALDINRRGFEVARALAPELADSGGIFVTVQDTGGRFGLDDNDDGERAWLGGLAGLAKTAAREWEEAEVRAIDLERADRDREELAEALVDELLAGGPELEVGLAADGTRRTAVSRRLEHGPGGEAGSALTEEDVVVVSGGARGVTAAVIIEWARRAPARFVLLGRTELEEEPDFAAGLEDEADLKGAAFQAASAAGESPKPAEIGDQVSKILKNREIRQTLEALEATGSRARYVSCDVRDREGLRAALDQVREDWGPVTGLVHGAGVLADDLIANKSRDQFDFVFDTKIDGLRALLEVTEEDPLTQIAMFASVAARTGNPGQSDYAMANEVLNKVAAREAARRGPDCTVKSFNWGPWEGGMVDETLRAHFEAQGIDLIPLQTGADIFADEMAGGAPERVEVVVGNSLSPAGFNGVALEGGARAAVQVDSAHYPWLDDHRIQGEVVVPAVLAREWILRMAEALQPGRAVGECREVRVHNGVTVEDFDGAGVTLVLRAELDEEAGEIEVGVYSEDGTLRYSGRVPLEASSESRVDLSASVDGSGLDADEIYDDGVLFHGPTLQVIDGLSAVGEEGIDGRMTVEEPDAGELGAGSWRADPRLADAALQFGCVWGDEQRDAPMLPMGFERAWVARGLDEHGEFKGRMRVREAKGSSCVADVAVVDADTGEVVAVFEGVKYFGVPSGEL